MGECINPEIENFHTAFLRIIEKKIERLSLFKMLSGFQIARLAERMNIEREKFSSDESE